MPLFAEELTKWYNILRTSPFSGNPLLSTFDSELRNGLSIIANVNLNDTQWNQAILPVYIWQPCWLILVRSVCMLASSAFLTSAATMLSSQILSDPIHGADDLAVFLAQFTWKIITPEAWPTKRCHQTSRGRETHLL